MENVYLLLFFFIVNLVWDMAESHRVYNLDINAKW